MLAGKETPRTWPESVLVGVVIIPWSYFKLNPKEQSKLAQLRLTGLCNPSATFLYNCGALPMIKPCSDWALMAELKTMYSLCYGVGYACKMLLRKWFDVDICMLSQHWWFVSVSIQGLDAVTVQWRYRKRWTESRLWIGASQDLQTLSNLHAMVVGIRGWK